MKRFISLTIFIVMTGVWALADSQIVSSRYYGYYYYGGGYDDCYICNCFIIPDEEHSPIIEYDMKCTPLRYYIPSDCPSIVLPWQRWIARDETGWHYFWYTDIFPGIVASVYGAYCKTKQYDYFTDKFDVPIDHGPLEEMDDILVIPDSLRVKCLDGHPCVNPFTGMEEDSVGVVVASIDAYAFTPYPCRTSYTYTTDEIERRHPEDCEEISYWGTGRQTNHIKYRNPRKVILPKTILTIGLRAFSSPAGDAPLPEEYGYMFPYGNIAYRLPEFLVRSNLEEINLENVINIEREAFVGCTKLKDINLQNVRSIEQCAFHGAGESIVFPKSLRTYSKYSINPYLKVALPQDSYKMPTQLTSPLKTITWDAYRVDEESAEGTFSSETIEIDGDTYPRNYTYSTMIIGDNVTTIYPKFCYLTSSLSNLVIGKNVNLIKKQAFAGTGLAEIHSYAQTPPQLEMTGADDEPFAGIDKKKCTLFVPEGCTGIYKATPIWQDFFIEEFDAAVEIQPADPPTEIKSEYIDIYGRHVEHPHTGQIVIRVETMSDGTLRTSKVVIR